MKLFKTKSKAEAQKKNVEKLSPEQLKKVVGGGDDAKETSGGNKGAGLMLTIPFGK